MKMPKHDIDVPVGPFSLGGAPGVPGGAPRPEFDVRAMSSAVGGVDVSFVAD